MAPKITTLTRLSLNLESFQEIKLTITNAYISMNRKCHFFLLNPDLLVMILKI